MNNKYMSSTFQSTLRDLFTTNPGKLLSNRNEDDTTSGSGNSQSQTQFPNSQVMDFVDSQDSQGLSQHDSPAKKFYGRYNAARANMGLNSSHVNLANSQTVPSSKPINHKLPYQQQAQMYKARAKENDERDLLKTMVSSMKDCMTEVHSAVDLVKASVSKGSETTNTQQTNLDNFIMKIEGLLHNHNQQMMQALQLREETKATLANTEKEVATRDVKIDALEKQLDELRAENREHLLNELSRTMSEQHAVTKEHIQDICRAQQKELTDHQDKLHQKLISHTEKVQKQISTSKSRSLDVLIDKLESVLSEHQDQCENDKSELREMIDRKIHALQERQKTEVREMLKKQEKEMKDQDHINQTEMTRAQQQQLRELQEKQQAEMESFIMEKLECAGRRQEDEVRSLVREVWAQEKEEASRVQAAQHEDLQQQLTKRYTEDLANLHKRHKKEVEEIKASLRSVKPSNERSSLPSTVSTACSPFNPIYPREGTDRGVATETSLVNRTEKKLDLFTGRMSQMHVKSGFMSPKIGQRLYSNKELFSKGSKVAPSPVATVKPQLHQQDYTSRSRAAHSASQNRQVVVPPTRSEVRPVEVSTHSRGRASSQQVPRVPRSPSEGTVQRRSQRWSHALAVSQAYGSGSVRSSSSTRIGGATSPVEVMYSTLSGVNSISDSGLKDCSFSVSEVRSSTSSGAVALDDVIASPGDPIPYNRPLNRSRMNRVHGAAGDMPGPGDDGKAGTQQGAARRANSAAREQRVGAREPARDFNNSSVPLSAAHINSQGKSQRGTYSSQETAESQKPRQDIPQSLIASIGKKNSTNTTIRATNATSSKTTGSRPVATQQSKSSSAEVATSTSNRPAIPTRSSRRLAAQAQSTTDKQDTNTNQRVPSSPPSQAITECVDADAANDCTEVYKNGNSNKRKKPQSGSNRASKKQRKKTSGNKENSQNDTSEAPNSKKNISPKKMASRPPHKKPSPVHQRLLAKEMVSLLPPRKPSLVEQQHATVNSLVPYSPTSSLASTMMSPEATALKTPIFGDAVPSRRNRTSEFSADYRAKSVNSFSGRSTDRTEGGCAVRNDSYTFTGDVTPFVSARSRGVAGKRQSQVSTERSSQQWTVAHSKTGLHADTDTEFYDVEDRWQKALGRPDNQGERFVNTSPLRTSVGRLVSPGSSRYSEDYQGSLHSCSRDSSPNVTLREVLCKKTDSGSEDEDDGTGGRWVETPGGDLVFGDGEDMFPRRYHPSTVHRYQHVERKVEGPENNRVETSIMAITRTVRTTRTSATKTTH